MALFTHSYLAFQFRASLINSLVLSCPLIVQTGVSSLLLLNSFATLNLIQQNAEKTSITLGPLI